MHLAFWGSENGDVFQATISSNIGKSFALYFLEKMSTKNI